MGRPDNKPINAHMQGLLVWWDEDFKRGMMRSTVYYGMLIRAVLDGSMQAKYLTDRL